MKSNQDNMRKGVCKYCGQVRMVTSDSLTEQTDVDALASKECDCPEAKIQRNREQRYEKARQNIVKIFKDRLEMVEILCTGARGIANNEIDGIAIKCGKKTAKASATSKGTIKISRVEKNEDSLEN